MSVIEKLLKKTFSSLSIAKKKHYFQKVGRSTLYLHNLVQEQKKSDKAFKLKFCTTLNTVTFLGCMDIKYHENYFFDLAYCFPFEKFVLTKLVELQIQIVWGIYYINAINTLKKIL